MGTTQASDVVNKSATPVITASVAYHADDALGGKLTFSDVVRDVGNLTKRSGLLHSIKITDGAKQKAAMDLILFNADFTATADHAAMDVIAADAVNLIHPISVSPGDYIDVASRSFAVLSNLSIPVKLGSAHMYAQLVVRGTPTFAAASDIAVEIRFIPDDV
jgi:hypothetical protein